ncbi:hypothetical protein M405DRAFT_27722 [Rhizopogon salebrosus TDB-379]|nr:hypothetical protein M405DRAFT_27722 [Rhizopogon salebrosus TDB-379]
MTRMQFTFGVGVASLAPAAPSEFGTGPRIGFGRSGSGRGLRQRRCMKRTTYQELSAHYSARFTMTMITPPPAMSVSPQPGSAPVANYITSPPLPSPNGNINNHSNAQLASLHHHSYCDNREDSQKHSTTKKLLERAERLLSEFQAATASSSLSRGTSYHRRCRRACRPC